ncbi:MAG: type II toxin-antitoxin system HicA family toxin [Chloroflexi bacterium]|nr:type II toxin-antitoxin system HicA family toxin [Chloroflexota bacterium]
MLGWRDVEVVLKRAGFIFDRQRGSHIVYYHPKTNRTVVFPKHREIRRGTLREILREMDITEEEFRKLLKNEGR